MISLEQYKISLLEILNDILPSVLNTIIYHYTACYNDLDLEFYSKKLGRKITIGYTPPEYKIFNLKDNLKVLAHDFISNNDTYLLVLGKYKKYSIAHYVNDMIVSTYELLFDEMYYYSEDTHNDKNNIHSIVCINDKIFILNSSEGSVYTFNLNTKKLVKNNKTCIRCIRLCKYKNLLCVINCIDELYFYNENYELQFKKMLCERKTYSNVIVVEDCIWATSSENILHVYNIDDMHCTTIPKINISFNIIKMFITDKHIIMELWYGIYKITKMIRF